MKNNTTLQNTYAEEKTFLNTLHTSYTEDHQTQALQRLVIRTISPFVQGGIGLELGCAEGYVTEMLARRVDALHVVDASEHFLADLRKRALPNVTCFQSLFEEYQSETQYDYVFASFILEHVLEVEPVLAMVKRVLKPGGKLCVMVPNARALSRQLALHMGLIKELRDLTDNDRRFGHRRVYDRVHLNREMEQAGFVTLHQGGIMLKILADFQLHQLIGDGFLQEAHIDGLYKLGLEYPDLCGALFSICTPV